MRIGADIGEGGDITANVDHRPPFGKARTKAVIFGKAACQTVNARCHHLAGKTSHWHRTGIHLDARNDTGIFNQLDQRRAVGGGLSDGFVKQDHTGNVALHSLSRAEHEFTVITAVGFGIFNLDGVEPLFDGAGALISGQKPLAVRHHSLRNFNQLILIHKRSPKAPHNVS